MYEDRKVKFDVMAKIQAVIGDKAILASNTSTLPISSLASEFKDPARFIGIHFFSPVDRMMLVEIILGKQTGNKALAVALDYVRAIRKTPIVVNDSRGFYTSRVVGTYIREGHLMLTRRCAGGDDRECRPHGRACRSVRCRSMTRWRSISPGKFSRPPRPISAPRRSTRGRRNCLQEMVEKRGRFGRKNGKGFYDYPANGPKKLWPGLVDLQPKKMLDPEKIDIEELKLRLLGIQALETVALLRGESAHRRARGGCRLDPRLRLCAVLRRYAVLDRHDGHEEASSSSAASSRRNTAPRFAPNKLLLDLAAQDEGFYQRFAPAKKKEAA